MLSGCSRPIVSTIFSQSQIILLIVGFTDARAIVDVTTKNIVAVSGKDVRITCTVNSKEPVLWETTPVGKTRPQPVYDGQTFVNNFSESGRFTLDNSSRPGCRDLIVSNVQLNDAGLFSCYESTNQNPYSELIVTEEIACTEKDSSSKRMGENEFGLPQSILAFHCSLNFRGNKRLVFCWFLNDDPIPKSTSTIIADGNSTIASGELNSLVAVRNLNSTVLAVKAVINTDTDSNQCGFNSINVHWKSKPLEIKFAALVNHPVKECPAVDWSLMCNPRCTYEQHQRADGSYYCQTNYTPDETYYFLQVNFTGCGSDYHILTIAVLAKCLVISVITICVILRHSVRSYLLTVSRLLSCPWIKPKKVDGGWNVAKQRIRLKNNKNPTQEGKSFTPTDQQKFDGQSNDAKQRTPLKDDDNPPQE